MKIIESSLHYYFNNYFSYFPYFQMCICILLFYLLNKIIITIFNLKDYISISILVIFWILLFYLMKHLVEYIKTLIELFEFNDDNKMYTVIIKNLNNINLIDYSISL